MPEKNQRTIREAITEEVKEGFGKAATTVAGVTRSVLDDAVTGLIDDVKTLTSGVFGVVQSITEMTKGIFSTITGGLFDSKNDDVIADETREQTSILGKIHDYFKRKEKRDMRQSTDGKGGLFGMVKWLILGIASALGLGLGGVTGFLATAIGGVVESIRLKFKLIGKIISPVTKFLEGLFSTIKRTGLGKKMLRPVDVAFDTIRAFFGRIGTLGSKVGKYLKTAINILKRIPVIGQFLSGFGRMFGKIFKFVPVVGQIFMLIDGVISFIKEFMDTEGNFVEKLKAGLHGVIRSFVIWPVKMLGKAADWLLNKIGINLFEDEGGIEGKVSGILNWLVKNFLDVVFNSIKWVGEKIVNLGKKLKEWFAEKFKDFSITDIFKGLWNKIIGLKDWLAEKLDFNLSDMFQGLLDNIKKIKNWIIDKFTGWMPDWIKDKMGLTSSETRDNIRTRGFSDNEETKNEPKKYNTSSALNKAKDEKYKAQTDAEIERSQRDRLMRSELNDIKRNVGNLDKTQKNNGQIMNNFVMSQRTENKQEDIPDVMDPSLALVNSSIVGSNI